MSEKVLQTLREYYKKYQPKEFLFEGQKGGKYSPESSGQVLKKAIKRAKN